MNPAEAGPPQLGRRQFLQGVFWAVLSAALTIALWTYAAQPENPKRDFYTVAAVLAGLATLVNAWSAYQGYRQSRTPPSSDSSPASPPG
jgi:hypothetical protein